MIVNFTPLSPQQTSTSEALNKQDSVMGEEVKKTYTQFSSSFYFVVGYNIPVKGLYTSTLSFLKYNMCLYL